MPDLPLPQTAAELLAQLVGFPTINPRLACAAGAAQQLLDHLAHLADAWGFATRWCPVPGGGANLLVFHEVSPDLDWILLESHVDTVGTEGMSVPPHELTACGGRFYGRGTCDTKGSGAAMLWALRDYSRSPARHHNAGVVFTLDEESGMSGAQAFAACELKEFKPLRCLVVGEPTQLQPVIAHNGVLRWRSVTRGLAAHSSRPERGRSAIAAMLPVIAALEEKFIPQANRTHPLTGRAAASINTIQGGTAVNIIPERCEIRCDRRLVPGEDPAVILHERDAALAGLAVEHDEDFYAPAMATRDAASLLTWMQPAFVATGITPVPAGAPYATNGGHYAKAGATVLVLGPGDIAQAHTHDEWLAAEQFDRAITLYTALLRLEA